jgi:hypothetical protein
LRLGHFVFGRFIVLVLGSFCSWDVMYLEHLWLGSYVLGRFVLEILRLGCFVLGSFVGISYISVEWTFNFGPFYFVFYLIKLLNLYNLVLNPIKKFFI